MQLNKYVIAAGALSLMLVACDRAETTDTATLPMPPSADLDVDLPDAEDLQEDATALTGTDSETDAPPRATAVSTNEIDWDAAKADMEASNPDGATRSIGIESAAPDAPVPILLPTGQNVQAATRSLGSAGPTVRATSDGYFAVYPGAEYDIIINGTNQTTDVAGKDRTRDESMTFTTSVAGAQVSLSRYGADYLVEFECRDLNEETGSCIEEAEAMEIAEGLVVRGSR